MKKLIASVLILVTVFTMSACGGIDKLVASNIPRPSKTENITEAPTAVEPETVSTENPSPETTAETVIPVTQPGVSTYETAPKDASPMPNMPAPASSNFFRNESNCAPDINSVSVKPCYVRYENGMLIADCFVINGLNTPVYNIYVDNLLFEDANDQLIAQAAFGELKGLCLGPNQYVLWSFTFHPEAVANQQADLSYLNCVTDTSYNY